MVERLSGPHAHAGHRHLRGGGRHASRAGELRQRPLRRRVGRCGAAAAPLPVQPSGRGDRRDHRGRVSGRSDSSIGEGRYSLEKWGYQSQLSMPLVSRGHVLGVVELCDYQPRDFAEDLDLIRGLGQVTAHALENASLFEQVDRRNRILNELVELGTLASRTRDLDRLVRSVAERVLSAVDAANCDIYRVLDGTLRCVAQLRPQRSRRRRAREHLRPRALPDHGGGRVQPPDPDRHERGRPQLSEDERTTYSDYGFSSEVCLPLVVNDEALRSARHLRHPRAGLRRVPHLPAQRRADTRGSVRERPPRRPTGAADDGPPRHRRARGGRVAGPRPRAGADGACGAPARHHRRRGLRHLHLQATRSAAL